MSYADPNNPNPFTAPAAPVAWQQPNLPLQPVHSLDYFRIYSYVFENPNWLTILLWAALCGLIPAIGSVLLTGYLFEVIGSLLTSRGQRYVDFDMNRFGEYLVRGVWPFLVAFATLFAVSLLIGVPMGLLMAIGSALGEDAGNAIVGVGVFVVMLISFPILLAMTVALIPMQFRAGMAGSFSEGFNIAWIKDYIGRVWLELILGILFLGFSSLILSTVAWLLCCLPVLLVTPLITLASAHFQYQLYAIYLTRGGQPIPSSASLNPVPLPQAMSPQPPMNPPQGFRE